MRYIDLFGGIGGFRYGIEKATKKKWECVWYCDNNKYAVSVYNKNYNENYTPADVRTIGTEQIPDHNLLCAGFPCQSFSIAGKRKGFEDTRGALFFEIARIARDKRPSYLFLENVKGLLSHENGETFLFILDTLSELGYDLEWQVLNSKDFGVPQNRERVFIIGHLGGEHRCQVFPIGEGNKIFIEKKRGKQEGREGFQGEISSTIDGRYGALRNAGETYMIVADRTRSYANIGRNLESPKEITNALSGVQKDNLLLESSKIRRLTPIECERLQGFPDNFSKYGINEKGQEVLISDSQRYKMLGNAVTTNVIEAIVKQMLERGIE